MLAGRARRALVVTGETPSRAVRHAPSGPGQLRDGFAGYTFGDAGAAVVPEEVERAAPPTWTPKHTPRTGPSAASSAAARTIRAATSTRTSTATAANCATCSKRHLPVPVAHAAAGAAQELARLMGGGEPLLTRYAVDQLASSVVLDVSRAASRGWAGGPYSGGLHDRRIAQVDSSVTRALPYRRHPAAPVVRPGRACAANATAGRCRHGAPGHRAPRDPRHGFPPRVGSTRSVSTRLPLSRARCRPCRPRPGRHGNSVRG
ncbi:hypothetical protein AB0E77_11200 [Streptomyces sp. NPDC032940]|uniref:hypothetical protein n=1 Tax=Streptomyces sp. NPDC032940 TaxID=3155366 RepID=UPI0033CB14AB